MDRPTKRSVLAELDDAKPKDPCDALKWAWINAVGAWCKVWRRDPKEPLTDEMLKAMVDKFHADDRHSRCVKANAGHPYYDRQGNRRGGERMELTAKRDELYARLQAGDRKIDTAPPGTDVSGWETFWLDLLHQYEAVCNELDALPEEAFPVIGGPAPVVLLNESVSGDTEEEE